jgi:hypothetical protein
MLAKQLINTGRFMMKKLLALALLALALPAYADSSASNNDHEEEHAWEKNGVGLFVGGAFKGERDNDLALGAEYNRHFTDSFGMGILAEYTFADEPTWVYAVMFSRYVRPHWKFYIAPGIEDAKHSEFLIRVGVEGKAFDIAEWAVAPQIDVDFVSGETTFVVGVTVGKEF